MNMLDRLLHAPKVRSSVLIGASAVAVLASTLSAVPAATAGPVGGTDPCALTPKLENPCRPLLGAESNHYPYQPGVNTFPDRMKEHETRIGRQVDIVHIYVTDKPTMTKFEKQEASQPGRIPLVNWKVSTDWSAAADGSLDDTIDVMAEDIKTIPNKVMFAVAHEPEDNLTPSDDPSCPTAAKTDSRGTPTDYVDMWHRVRERFDAAGVDNVVWVMNYMGYSRYFGCAETLWPGNAFVDWVMWDPYPNTYSFTETIGGFYDYLTTHSDAEHDFLSKPWGLAEWGFVGKSQPAAHAMYAEAAATLHANVFPKLRAYVIWDNLVVGGNDNRLGYDASSNPDPAEQAAYNAFANDPTFSPDDTAPSQVTGLVADSVTGTSAHLRWNPASDAVRVAGYRVYRDGALVETLTSPTPGYSDTGLVDGRTYQYAVSAFDPSGNESAPSDAMPVTTPDRTAPRAPTGLRATLSGRSVRLTWTEPTDNVGVTSYAVYRGTTLLGSPTTPAFTDPAPPQGTRLSYSVKAVDAARNVSVGSSTATVTVRDTTAPANPTRLTAVAGRKRITLTWTRATDNVAVTGYRLYRGTTRIKTLSGSALSHTDTGLRTGRRYTYKVVAVDGAGNASTGRSTSAKAK